MRKAAMISSAHRAFFSTGTTPKPKHYDVLIIGGGVAGSSLANRLTSKSGEFSETSTLKIGVMDPKLAAPFSDYSDASSIPDGSPSARAYALSSSSLETLGEDTIGRLAGCGRVSNYDKMQVWESNGPACLHFSSSDLISNAETDRASILGSVIEDAPLVSALWDNLRQQPSVDIISPAKLSSIQSSPRLQDGSSHTPPVKVSYQDTNTSTFHDLTANLVVAADGANSAVRESLSIPTTGFGYGRKAVTFTVETDSSMAGTAYQRFFPSGPIALLPIWDESHPNSNKRYANVVWSTTPSHAERLLRLTEAELLNQLNQSLGEGPTLSPPLTLPPSLPTPLLHALSGAEKLFHAVNNSLTVRSWAEGNFFRSPPPLTAIVGPRFSFDLRLSHAQRYVARRVALIGDAAHTVHPMAGQGLNLGISDVECLARQIRKATRGGMDIGDDYFLECYEEERKKKVWAVMGGVQLLHEAFGTEWGVGVNVRSLGMNLVNAIGPLKKRLVEVAAYGG